MSLITVPCSHFVLDYYGSPGIKVTPNVKGDIAEVIVETWVTGPGEWVKFTIDSQTLHSKVIDGYAQSTFLLNKVRLWDGVDDPTYTLLTPNCTVVMKWKQNLAVEHSLLT